MQEMTIAGTVERFLFQNKESSFVVFVLAGQRNMSTIVTGTLPGIAVGQEVKVRGEWVTHKKFGKQFQASACITQVPTSIIGLKKYLGSGLIKGIGPVYAEKLVDFFGADVLKIIDSEPGRMSEVAGIGKKRIETIVEAWKEQKDVADIMVFLRGKDISPVYAAKIYKKYRHDALAVLHENPYRLADEIWGIGFQTADKIAQKLGFGLQCPQRIAAGILYILSTRQTQGHAYCELEELKKSIAKLLELTQEHVTLVRSSLYKLYEQQKITYITHKEKHYIGTMMCYAVERGITQKIERLMQNDDSRISCDCNQVYKDLRLPQHGINLNEEQQKGILACLQNKVTIVTGGPGTGKTTLLRSLLGVLDENQVKYSLAAPTGRAAKRMNESTGRYAMTLHRLLAFDPATMQFKHNENRALQLDILVIDEASMIDMFLFYAVLKALPDHAHIVLLGDIDQLPSVGAGNVLRDCIASKTVACVMLHEIFRQAQDSLIITNAHRVNHGEFPKSATKDSSKKDFFYKRIEEPGQLQPVLKSLLYSYVGRAGIKSASTQILVPMNRGIVGTHALNSYMQELLNPGKKSMLVFGGVTYKVGDRVMQVRNNYDKNVFNGDMGIVQDIDASESTMFVEFGGRLVEYSNADIYELVLAYAVTIHKSQGSEYDAVIIPVFMQHFTLLQRNLIYTAITRAKRLCILVGQVRAIAMAIKNDKNVERVTFLREFLTKEL